MFSKTDTEELFFMSGGRVLKSVGAATEKDLAPYVIHSHTLKLFSSCIKLTSDIPRCTYFHSFKKVARCSKIHA